MKIKWIKINSSIESIKRFTLHACLNQSSASSLEQKRSQPNQQTDDQLDNLIKDKLSSVSPPERPLKNEPFIKSLFCGRFVFDYLKYPEYDRTHKLNDLMSKYVDPVENHFSSASYENTIDKNGNLFITGRIKELIITAGGENIAPILIENEVKK